MRYSKSDNLKAITADVKSAICILGLEFIHSNPRMQIAKNTYGGRFAVYRIADCAPMREKRPLTSKQQLAGQRLSVLSRQKSSMARIFCFSVNMFHLLRVQEIVRIPITVLYHWR